VDMLEPQPTLVQRLVRHVLLLRGVVTAGEPTRTPAAKRAAMKSIAADATHAATTEAEGSCGTTRSTMASLA